MTSSLSSKFQLPSSKDSISILTVCVVPWSLSFIGLAIDACESL